ncbi:hypothetical protein GCM10011297_31530 [Bacterioplanes sanyensis]|nr:hypothetical protein [Bacterioplanes sanyensis]GGY56425.1 hypothetical protein GCM10011297_31530 [Bacterioplanes sanyensis]
MHFYECELIQLDNYGEHEVIKIDLADGKTLLHQGINGPFKTIYCN